MSNDITPGKRVLVKARPEDRELTPGIVQEVVDRAGIPGLAHHQVLVLVGGKTVTRPMPEVKLATQDADPAAWMLHDGKTSKHAPGVQEIGLERGCYVCADPEFAQMGLPLCRKCPECMRQGRGPGHIAADETACDECGYEDCPEDYPQPTRVLTPPYTAKTIATRTAPGEAYEVTPSAFVPVPDVEWIDGSGATVTVPEDCTVQGVNIMDSSEPSVPFFWLHVGKALQAGDQIHVPGTVHASEY